MVCEKRKEAIDRRGLSTDDTDTGKDAAADRQAGRHGQTDKQTYTQTFIHNLGPCKEFRKQPPLLVDVGGGAKNQISAVKWGFPTKP